MPQLFRRWSGPITFQRLLFVTSRAALPQPGRLTILIVLCGLMALSGWAGGVHAQWPVDHPSDVRARSSIVDPGRSQLSSQSPRSKIGLVLSGGGARGAAHVGVIKVLDELRIPIDYIAGSSMGAIVGGLYASGLSAEELEHVLAATDWPLMLADRPPRARRSFRRKSDDIGFLVNFDLGVSKQGLHIPQGIVQGQTLTLYLRRLLLPVVTINDFDRLPIPFRAIATNIETGAPVSLGAGDLPTAIRASMSAPGVFKPVRVAGELLVDGGVADNLPIGVVKAMGADTLIVVDVGFPLMAEAELDSALKITSQMLTILINARSEQQKQLLTDDDVVVVPPLGQLGSEDFDQTAHARDLGEFAARQAWTELSRLSVSPQAYRDHRRSIKRAQPQAPVIDQVLIENQSRLSANVIEARLADQRGAALDVAQLESDIADIYGLDTFETVDYTIQAEAGGTTLRLRSTDKSWGPSFVKFGINLEDDFQGSSNYNLAARVTRTEINGKGGELRADAVIGETPQLAVELYQPLDYASRWFLNPRLQLQRSTAGLFDDSRQLAEFRSKDAELSLGFGRQFGNWGELRLTLARGYSDDDVQIGDPSLGGGNGNAASVGLSFGYDTIDRLAVPRYGTNFSVSWLGLRQGFGGDQTADLGQAFLLKPVTWGSSTLLHWWDLASVTRSAEGPANPLRLGGLFNLSGYGASELEGRHRAMGRLLYYRRLGAGRMPLIDTPIYLGASLEAGNVWSDSDAISLRNTLVAGSAFVVVDSILGPLYLAYGAAEGGSTSAYLFLGQTF